MLSVLYLAVTKLRQELVHHDIFLTIIPVEREKKKNKTGVDEIINKRQKLWGGEEV